MLWSLYQNIPTPRCLHQSRDGSLELAHFVSTFRIDKTFWLHHIQLFFKEIHEGIQFWHPFARFHKMRQLLTWFGQTFKHRYEWENLIVVNTLTLSKTFCDNSSFVDSNTTISVRLPLEDPFILNDSPIIGQVNQSPYIVLIHGSHLRFYGLKPFRGTGLIIASS